MKLIDNIKRKFSLLWQEFNNDISAVREVKKPKKKEEANLFYYLYLAFIFNGLLVGLFISNLWIMFIFTSILLISIKLASVKKEKRLLIIFYSLCIFNWFLLVFMDAWRLKGHTPYW
jgi:hypothetical protein